MWCHNMKIHSLQLVMDTMINIICGGLCVCQFPATISVYSLFTYLRSQPVWMWLMDCSRRYTHLSQT